MPESDLCQSEILTCVRRHAAHFQRPFVLVLELAHFAMPCKQHELAWAIQNLRFCEKTCSALVKEYRREIRIVPCVLVNDLSSEIPANYESIPADIARTLEGNVYLSPEKVVLISERNLRNTASKRLTHLVRMSQLSTDLDANFDRLFYKEATALLQETCPAIGNINLDDGHVVPRCTSILASLHERAASLARNRLHSAKNVDLLLLSFAKNHHENVHTISGARLFHGPWPTPKRTFDSIGRFDTVVVLWSPESTCEISSLEGVEQI